MVQPIAIVCSGDSVKFAINIFNMYGLVDVKSIQWESPVVQRIPNIPDDLDPNNIENIDRRRICEVQEFHTEWVDCNYFHRQKEVELLDFTPQLERAETECSGVGVLISKSTYNSAKEGKG